MNVTNAVHHLLLVLMIEVAVVVMIGEVEAGVGDMAIIEAVDLVILKGEEVTTITAVGIITMMVEEAIGVVLLVVTKPEKMVDLLKVVIPQPSRTVALVETTHPHMILMVGMQIMDLMQFLQLQAILVDLHQALHLMGATQVGMMVVLVLLVKVDLVELLLNPRLK